MELRALLVDYNGFFASCERQERPELRERPVGVIPIAAESTCVIAATYDARARGVKVGTSVAEARKLCPEIALIESRPEVYIHYHEKLLEAVETCLPVTEVWSIDEVWCELPPRWRRRDKALATARDIKRAIAQLAGTMLTCSIGISANPWLAKIASEMQKPDGLTVLEEADLPQRLFELELGDLPGVGRNMQPRLERAGITTVEEICAASRHKLRSVWGGIEGERMWQRLRGEHVPLPPKRTSSIGHSHVLPPELRNLEGARATLHRLLQKAAMRLRYTGYYTGGMHIGLRFGGDERWSTAATFIESQDTQELTRVFGQLWQRRPKGKRTIRHVGICFFNLSPFSQHTGVLPGIVDNGDRRAKLNASIDHINRKLGKNTVVYGGALGALQYAPVRIAFTRIPDLLLEEGEPDGELFPTAAELARAQRLPQAGAH